MSVEEQGPARVLVVDDNHHIVEVLRMGLSYGGFEVITASSGREGVELAREASPDLILLDVMMPGMGGLEVCQALKDDERTTEIPIIFLSARTTVPDRVQGLDMGAVDYVTKPFDMDEVISRARVALRTRARQEARSRDIDKFKKDFLHLLTHEMATPLTAIQGFSELLEMGLSHMTPSAQMDCFRVINQSSRKLSGALDDFLCLAQGDTLTSIGAADIVALLQEQIDELAPECRERQQAVHLEVSSPAIPPVASHPRFLPRALYHLLANALKFSPDGSVARVRVSAEGGFVRVDVEDQGQGIDPKLHELIFERFYQADSSRTRAYSGMGLGLSVARTLARALKGDITVQSAAGAGSVFSLRLPAGKTPG